MSDTPNRLLKVNAQQRNQKIANELADTAAEKHLNKVVRPAENSWYVLEQAIQDPADIEKMSSDHEAIARAVKEVARAAKLAGHDTFIRRALENAEFEDTIDFDCIALLIVVSDVMSKPGSASELVSRLELGSFPRNVVVDCRRRVLWELQVNKSKPEKVAKSPPKSEKKLEHRLQAHEPPCARTDFEVFPKGDLVDAVKLTVNKRMAAKLMSEADSQGWTAQQWADYLGCGKSTVVETKAWKSLKIVKADAQLSKTAPKATHRRSKRPNK